MKPIKSDREVLTGDVIETGYVLSIDELCERCVLGHDQVREMVQEGVLDPGTGSHGHWQFTFSSVRRVRTAQRLQRDLGVNLAGAALALELLDRLEQLEQRLRRLGG